MFGEEQTKGPQQSARCAWETGGLFCGTRVCPGSHESATRLARGVQTAVLSIAKAYANQAQDTPESK
jgi:hypothetical protein